MSRSKLYVVQDKIEPDINHPETWPHRLFISIPIGELTYSWFWQNLHTVRGYGWHVERGLWSSLSGGMIHQNHVQLVHDALKVKGWDRLVFLENDHSNPPDALFKHSQYTQPIVAGLYVQRKVEEPLPVIYYWDQGRNNIYRPTPEQMNKMLSEPGLYEVDVVGFGCISIRRDVLENWPKDIPMFSTPMNPRGTNLMSDDTWFCRIAQDNGYTIWVDTSLQVDHFALLPIGAPLFVRWWNQKQRSVIDKSQNDIQK